MNLKEEYSEDMDHYHKHDKDAVSDKELEKICDEDMGEVGDWCVYKVDGEYIRNNVNIDFVQGGNPGRYTFIPEEQVWVENNLKPNDFTATAIHEIVECALMEDKGWSYDKAHDMANQWEDSFRSGNKKIKSYSEVVDFLNEHLYDFLKDTE